MYRLLQWLEVYFFPVVVPVLLASAVIAALATIFVDANLRQVDKLRDAAAARALRDSQEAHK